MEEGEWEAERQMGDSNSQLWHRWESRVCVSVFSSDWTEWR